MHAMQALTSKMSLSGEEQKVGYTVLTSPIFVCLLTLMAVP